MKDPLKELEKKVSQLEKRISKIEDKKDEETLTMPKPNTLEDIVIRNFKTLKTQDLIILSLHLKPKQTKDDIKEIIRTWGGTKKTLNWFLGGNFSQRLIGAGLVFESGKNQKNVEQYSLTKGNGVQRVMTIIKKLNTI